MTVRRVVALLFAAATATSDWEADLPGAALEALTADDECSADLESSECALSALQRQALRRTALTAAAAAAEAEAKASASTSSQPAAAKQKPQADGTKPEQPAPASKKKPLAKKEEPADAEDDPDEDPEPEGSTTEAPEPAEPAEPEGGEEGEAAGGKQKPVPDTADDLVDDKPIPEDDTPAAALQKSREVTFKTLTDSELAGSECPVCFPKMCYLPTVRLYKQCTAATPYYDARTDMCLNRCLAGDAPAVAATTSVRPATANAASTAPAAAAAKSTAKPSAAGACATVSGGTCRIFGCGNSFGPVACLKGQCICDPGYCADKSGVCKKGPASVVATTPPPTCVTATQGTCRVFGCGSSFGPTACKDSKCVCQAGHCVDATGVCKKM